MTSSFVITIWQYMEIFRLAYEREYSGEILIKNFFMVEDDPELLSIEIELDPKTPKKILDELYEILELPHGES